MVNKTKLNIVLGITVLLLILSIAHGCHESYLDSKQVVGIGKLVLVKNGFYTGCKGRVVEPVYSTPVTDRYGTFHPSIFAGYNVDLTCNNEHTGDRLFTPDFLRVIREK